MTARSRQTVPVLEFFGETSTWRIQVCRTDDGRAVYHGERRSDRSDAITLPARQYDQVHYEEVTASTATW